jgi:hypothetical protein
VHRFNVQRAAINATFGRLRSTLGVHSPMPCARSSAQTPTPFIASLAHRIGETAPHEWARLYDPT